MPAEPVSSGAQAQTPVTRFAIWPSGQESVARLSSSAQTQFVARHETGAGRRVAEAEDAEGVAGAVGILAADGGDAGGPAGLRATPGYARRVASRRRRRDRSGLRGDRGLERAIEACALGARGARLAPALEGRESRRDLLVARSSRNEEAQRLGPLRSEVVLVRRVRSQCPYRPGVASAGFEAVVPRGRPARRRFSDPPRPGELRLPAAVEPEHRELVAGRAGQRAPGEGRTGARRFDRAVALAGRDRDEPGARRGRGEPCEQGGCQGEPGGTAGGIRSVHARYPRKAGPNPGISGDARRSALRRHRTARAGRPRGRRRA